MTAVEMRQPKLDPGPNAAMPSAISHLPRGGCTTNDAVSSSALVSPFANISFAPVRQDPSYPCTHSDQASLT